MSDNRKTLVLLDASPSLLESGLEMDRIVRELKKAPEVQLVELRPEDAPDIAAAFAEQCRQAAPGGVVAVGGSGFLDVLPDVAICKDDTDAHRLFRVNVLERCAMLHENMAVASDLALRQIHVAIAAARTALPLAFADQPVSRRVAVLGYGEAGLLVAEMLRNQGLPVTMIAAPDRAYADSRAPEDVDLMRDAVIDDIAGNVGAFRLTLRTGGETVPLEAGAIVVAARPHLQPLRLSEEMSLSGRVTALSAWTLQLDELPTPERVCIWMDHQGQEARSVAYSTYLAAERSLELGYNLTILFRNAPVYGATGQLRYDRIRQAGATLIRYDQDPTWTLSNDRIRFDVQDVILPEDTLSFEVDRIVVPEKVLPSKMNGPLARMLHQPLDDDGFFQPCNVRHLPVGSPRRGLFYVGNAHRDVDPEETADEARAAAAQITALLAPGKVRVPRELVTVDKRICASCLTCLRSCQHGAIRLEPGKRSVQFIAEACWECGVCAAVCPRKAITRSSFSEAQLVEAIGQATAELSGARPRVVFGCRNSASDALESAGRLGLHVPDDMVWIEVPCAGHLSENEIAATLIQGAASVDVFGCHHDNCRSEIGSLSAHRRTEEVRRSLAALGLDANAVRFHTIAANEPYRLVHVLWKRESTIANESTNSTGERAHG